jgi:hypothetical protein
MAAVGAGAGLAGAVSSLKGVPGWVPFGVAFGIAALAVVYTHHNQPLKVIQLRSKLLQAVIIGPVTAVLIWQLLKVAS